VRAMLERVLGTPVAGLAQRPYEYETSHALEELEVELGDGRVLHLLHKDLGRVPPSRPAFLHDPAREIETYRRLLAPAGLGTAVFHGSEGAHLFIEKVEGVELWQVGELETWRHVARWLRRMHDAFPGGAEDIHLLRYDGDFFRLWLARAAALAGDLGPVAGIHDAVVERLLGLPQSVVHGDFYPSNVLVAGERVCPVDWELAGWGPSLLDLAALTSGWPEDEQAAIAAAYGDVSGEDLDCCRLHLAVRWLGWSEDWKPPPEHARDWRAEALALAERLPL
jgi:hypothetical protein